MVKIQLCVIKTFFMTNILVPTDFTVNSLKLAAKALRNDRIGRCNLILFHAFELPESPFDLLGSRYKDPAGELMNEPFRQACKQFKENYSQKVSKVIVRTLIGDTRNVFRNFAEANDIDLIYCPEDYVFLKAHKRSVNPTSLFKNCGVPFLKMEQTVVDTKPLLRHIPQLTS